MPKVQTQNIDKNERYEMIGDFYNIVTNLKTKKEVIGFFMGLLTPSEALMFARRIQIAQMLLEDNSYDEIRAKLGVGPSTITNVSRWLYDENDQFQSQIKKHMSMKDKKVKGKSRNYDSLLDRYPQHRILKDLLGL